MDAYIAKLLDIAVLEKTLRTLSMGAKPLDDERV